MNKFLKNPTSMRIVIILAIIIVAIFIFGAGISVGYHRAIFTMARQSGYGRGFNDPRSPFAPFFHDSDHANSHGTVGEIIKVTLPAIMVKSSHSAEQVVNISSSTIIRSMYATASTSDLVIGDRVVIIGAPNQNGSIDAAFVRILPSASTSAPTNKP